MAFIPMVSVWSIFDLAFGVDGCCELRGMEEMGPDLWGVGAR